MLVMVGRPDPLTPRIAWLQFTPHPWLYARIFWLDTFVTQVVERFCTGCVWFGCYVCCVTRTRGLRIPRWVWRAVARTLRTALRRLPTRPHAGTPTLYTRCPTPPFTPVRVRTLRTIAYCHYIYAHTRVAPHFGCRTHATHVYATPHILRAPHCTVPTTPAPTTPRCLLLPPRTLHTFSSCLGCLQRRHCLRAAR